MKSVMSVSRHFFSPACRCPVVPTAIGWKGCPCSAELDLLLCQKSVHCIFVSLFLSSPFPCTYLSGLFQYHTICSFVVLIEGWYCHSAKFVTVLQYVLAVLMYKSCIFFVKFIFKNFVTFYAIINEIIFLISLLDCLWLVYWNTVGFAYWSCILQPCWTCL